MRMSKAAIGLCAVAALASTAVYAGYRSGWQVGVDTVNRNAYGTMANVRASADSNQYIGCSVRTYNSGATIYVYCFASDAVGNYGSCNTTASNFVTTAHQINGDSHIYFSWDSSGNCTYLYVDNESSYAPKSP